MSDCHVELFRNDEGPTPTGRWGWQCWTHHVDQAGFSNIFNAEAEAADHERQQRHAAAS